jgi:hypothetical protein
VLAQWQMDFIKLQPTFQFVVRVICRRQLPSCMDGICGSQREIQGHILKKWHFRERLLPVYKNQ